MLAELSGQRLYLGLYVNDLLVKTLSFSFDLRDLLRRNGALLIEAFEARSTGYLLGLTLLLLCWGLRLWLSLRGVLLAAEGLGASLCRVLEQHPELLLQTLIVSLELRLLISQSLSCLLVSCLQP